MERIVSPSTKKKDRKCKTAQVSPSCFSSPQKIIVNRLDLSFLDFSRKNMEEFWFFPCTPTTAFMTPLTSSSFVTMVSVIMSGYVDQIKLLRSSTNAIALLQIATGL